MGMAMAHGVEMAFYITPTSLENGARTGCVCCLVGTKGEGARRLKLSNSIQTRSLFPPIPRLYTCTVLL